MKKKKKNPKSISTKFVEVFNSIIGAIGVILGSIAIIPIISDWVKEPRIEIIRQAVYEDHDRIIAEYQIVNSGSAIANDIFLQIQSYKKDKLYMPFSVKYSMRTDSINWEIDINSLAPGESTSITVLSPHVSEFAQRKEVMRTLPNPINFVWADYREGKREDIIFGDSPEITELIASMKE